ncbi:cytochrome oxidase small assembly protein [Thauera aromatica]|nr:cytochrome oxidase small assembly protein [Thauera aromatica]MCK2089744.1 cytochrome oxidase small assembly protein [Thauera aromatica]MCK2126233.1 cytochrome oxidase small assembly protein [Thauera aromatica]
MHPSDRDRRTANRRTGLMLAAVAAAFFVFVILKYQVFGR